MAQSPSDMDQNAGVVLPQGRYSGATIIMDAKPGEPVNRPVESAQPDQLAETVPVGRRAAESRHEADEPSIEEYMAALLARTRQFSASPPAPAESQTKTMSPSGDRKASPRAEPAPQPAAPASATPPSECRTAISELRELANISAQSSFNAHRAQHLVREMRGKRFVAIIAMFTSVLLLWIAPTVQSPAYIMAVTAVITACAFSLKYLTLGRELAHLCADTPLDDQLAPRVRVVSDR